MQFNPTHILKINSDLIPVQEIPGDNEFFTEDDFKEWYPEPCAIGSYSIDEFDKSTVLQSYTGADEELGEVLLWREVDNASITAICTQCGSHNTVRNGTNGYSQRYKCKRCGSVFTSGVKSHNSSKLPKSLITRNQKIISFFQTSDSLEEFLLKVVEQKNEKI